MDENQERNLTVIKSNENSECQQVQPVKRAVYQSVPFAKKLLKFHSEKAHKFSVRDLFKK